MASFSSCSRRASNERRTQRADFRRRDIRISRSLTDVSPCRPNLRPADRLQRGLAVSSLHTPRINATHFSWKQSQARGGGASNNQPPFSLHRLLYTIRGPLSYPAPRDGPSLHTGTHTHRHTLTHSQAHTHTHRHTHIHTHRHTCVHTIELHLTDQLNINTSAGREATPMIPVSVKTVWWF